MDFTELQCLDIHELMARKRELEKALDVLMRHTLDDVTRELGEVDYLLGKSVT